MIYQCSNCGSEFEGVYNETQTCPVCHADASSLIEQPFNVLNGVGSYYNLDDEG
mgnify:CR=1 FL=1